jgi:hypothetical protein
MGRFSELFHHDDRGDGGLFVRISTEKRGRTRISPIPYSTFVDQAPNHAGITRWHRADHLQGPLLCEHQVSPTTDSKGGHTSCALVCLACRWILSNG